ncbi:MAG: discoidin domain-containing protein, partial [Armatimonadota bacterium]
MKRQLTRGLLFTCGLLACGLAQAALTDRQRQVEADWVLQEAQRQPVTTRDDALGAVDGLKDGKWAFHTSLDKDPWWQVDLGRGHALTHALIFNRCDAADRASRLMVLLSDDGKSWRQVYQHDGTVFYGATDGKPLNVPLTGQTARFLRVQLPGQQFLHLDEVEVYGAVDPARNLALWQEADQSSISTWSKVTARPGPAAQPSYQLDKVLERGRLLSANLRGRGVDTRACDDELQAVTRAAGDPAADRGTLWRRARWAVRRLAFRNPLLDFDSLVFVKRAPGSFSHMSDQYYGWWSRPGGGVCLLSGLKSDNPQVRCLTAGFPTGSFLEPELSYDGKQILFAYCQYFPDVAALRDKQNKENVPEAAFYHVY